MKFNSFLPLFFLLSNLGLAQSFSVSGKVIDDNQHPVAFANVIVMTQQDSTIVKGVSTDDSGLFNLTNLEMNTYIFKISFIGFQEYFKVIETNRDIDLGTIVLEEETQSLDEVNIVFKKPTFKREADRMVFNVESTALTEGNMLQVLKSTPGVLVINNNIVVKNSAPTVYINNRKVNLTASELTQLLESSSANAIKSIEVITNPSAKYDASSGVVLNIVMSKNLVTGYRGNVFGNYTQGVFPIYNVGTSHFFKSEKINFYGSYSFTDSKENREDQEDVNYFDSNQNINEYWRSKLNRNKWTKTHNFNINFDYHFDDKNTLSLSSNMLFLPYFKYKISNTTNVFDASQNLDFYFDSNNLLRDTKHNLAFDLDYTHDFKKGKLSVSAHYTDYDHQRDQGVISHYFDEDDTPTGTSEFRTDNNQSTKIATGQTDYSLPINESTSFETGFKVSHITTDSNITQYDIVNGQEVLDANNTDVFAYQEDILAAYMNYSKDWAKWSVILGLRTEQTKVEGVSLLNNTTNQQDYFNWFPNASLTFNAFEKMSMYSSYKRSIQRPDYQRLNPFRFFYNSNTVEQGNPDLQPEIQDHFVVGTSFLDHFTVEAYYKNSKNNIVILPRQDNDTNIISYTPLNLNKTIEYGFDFVFNSYLTERWAIYFVTSFYNIEDQESFGNTPIKQDQWSNYSVLQNDFTFLEDRSLNMNFTLYYVGKNLQGFRTVEERWVSSLSLTKSIFNKRAVISLSAEDLFNLQDFESSTHYLNQSSSSKVNLDNRNIKIGFRYNFGNTNLKTNSRTKDLKERDRLKDNHN
ncbi:TonB-dependent receptor domain-containing protein [Geojedonia litorea]|uniref:TonB-dependent receptor domain-containing protein n=1 Tax=Geojedonia litorea TaxID=1268269 RepID=A0ABV9N726_9FLAO